MESQNIYIRGLTAVLHKAHPARALRHHSDRHRPLLPARRISKRPGRPNGRLFYHTSATCVTGLRFGLIPIPIGPARPGGHPVPHSDRRHYFMTIALSLPP